MDGWPVGKNVGITFVVVRWMAVYENSPADCSYTVDACSGHVVEVMLSVMGQFFRSGLSQPFTGTVMYGWFCTVNITVVLGSGNSAVTVMVFVAMSARAANATFTGALLLPVAFLAATAATAVAHGTPAVTGRSRTVL